jgi:hypothetical protein
MFFIVLSYCPCNFPTHPITGYINPTCLFMYLFFGIFIGNISSWRWDQYIFLSSGTNYPMTSYDVFFLHGATAPSRPGSPHYRGFAIMFKHPTLSRTPLDEWSAQRRDLYLTTHNTHKTRTPMPLMWFKTAIPASEWPQIHTIDCVAIGISDLFDVPGKWVSPQHCCKNLKLLIA